MAMSIKWSKVPKKIFYYNDGGYKWGLTGNEHKAMEKEKNGRLASLEQFNLYIAKGNRLNNYEKIDLVEGIFKLKQDDKSFWYEKEEI